MADPRTPRPPGQRGRGDAFADDGRSGRGDASAAEGRSGRNDASAAEGRSGRGGPPVADSGRALAQRVLRRVASEDAFATLALGAALASSGLDVRERRLATELVYGVLRHQRRLDRALAAMTPRGLGKLNLAVLTILRVAAYELLFLDRIPAHAAVSSAVGAVRRLGGQRLAGFANGVLRRLAREGEPALPPATDLRAHVEVACSLPRWIVDRLAAEVGEASLAEAAAALNEPAPLTLRVQRLRIDRDALLARLRAEYPDATLTASPWAPQAIVAHGLGDPERSAAFAEGLFTVQDVGAQLVGHLVAPAPGWRILDACAGLGGKTTHLAELTDDRAVIDAADLSRAKLRLGADTAARLGLASVRTAPPIDLLLDPASDAWHAAALADAYDAVLLDAPCTGLGVLRRHPEAKLRLGDADIGRMSALQAQLLDAVAGRVRPGGILVYSVCTFTHEEGPGQIEHFLARHPAFVLEPPPEAPADAPPAASADAQPGASLAAPLAGIVDWHALASAPAGEGAAAEVQAASSSGRSAAFRVWPHRHGADAFFLARLRRRP